MAVNPQLVIAGVGLAMNLIGGSKADKAAKAQASKNAAIEEANRRLNANVAKRNIKIMEESLKTIEDEAKLSASLMEEEFSFQADTARRGISRDMGTGRTRGMSRDVMRDVLFQGERSIGIAKVQLGNKLRANDYSKERRIYDTKLEIQNIGIRAKAGTLASEARQAQFTASANDNSYMFSMLGTALSSGADIYNSYDFGKGSQTLNKTT